MLTATVISFTTRPSRGGEGGVGWHFLKAAAQRAHAFGGPKLNAIIDARDAEDVATALSHSGLAPAVNLLPVSLPEPLRSRFGDRRSRASYLAWVLRARRQASKLRSDVVHQFTFATASMPSAISGGSSALRIWGPVGLPPELRSQSGWRGKAARSVLHLELGRIHRIVALNDESANAFGDIKGEHVSVEPNIVCEPQSGSVTAQPDLIAMVGLLIPRKRPWLAIEALSHPSLAEARLRIIGDGPLRGELEDFATSAGVANRVEFTGRLERQAAVDAMAEAHCLMHPSSREGSPWAIGEAAAAGLAAVAFEESGSGATVRMSANGGIIIPAQRDAPASIALAEGTASLMETPRPAASPRWSSDRIPSLLNDWWTQ